jgi:hypothetical protein
MNVSTIWDKPVTDAELNMMYGDDVSSESVQMFEDEIKEGFTSPFAGKLVPHVRSLTTGSSYLLYEPVEDTIIDGIDHKDVWPLVMEMLADTTNPKAVAVLQAMAKVHVNDWAYECALAAKR